MALPSTGVADLPDCGTNVRVGGAAADVAAHELGDVLIRRGVALLEQLHRGHDLTGRAVAALEGVVLDERPLHRVKLAVRRQALDRRDLVPLAGDRERQAREHPSAIHPDRAGAARALVAALLRAREA